eukprot:3498666-Lingulodinium_polyedra.AAC.1
MLPTVAVVGPRGTVPMTTSSVQPDPKENSMESLRNAVQVTRAWWLRPRAMIRTNMLRFQLR